MIVMTMANYVSYAFTNGYDDVMVALDIIIRTAIMTDVPTEVTWMAAWKGRACHTMISTLVINDFDWGMLTTMTKVTVCLQGSRGWQLGQGTHGLS